MSLTESQKRRLLVLYPNTDNKELAEMFGTDVTTVIRIAGNNGVYKTKEYISNKYHEVAKRRWAERRGEELVDDDWSILELFRLYPTHSNKELAKRFNMKIGSVAQLAKRNGIKKDAKYISKIRRKANKIGYGKKIQKIQSPN